MTTSYHQGTGNRTTTLATFNRYVDNVTGASKIERWYEQPGSLPVGEPVLYWKEDLKKIKIKKSKIKIKK